MADANRWSGKTPEEVLLESFHEIRNPILITAGYLNVLKSEIDSSDEQVRYFLDAAIHQSLIAKEIVESVYKYINEKRGNQ